MFKEKFDMVLQKDEEIKWSNRTNISANIFNWLIVAILGDAFLSFWITMFLNGFLFEEKQNGGPYIFPIVYFLPIFLVLYFVYMYLKSKNTYFAITNKRIIKRTGAFNNSFIHYTLKNVGTVQVAGKMFDNNSATLSITTKNFHTDNNTNASLTLKIHSLYKAYEAYNILSELVEGNNENLRVKIEK